MSKYWNLTRTLTLEPWNAPLNVIFLITIIFAIAIKEFKSSPKGSRGNIFGLQISIHYQHHDDIQLKFVQCVICV